MVDRQAIELSLRICASWHAQHAGPTAVTLHPPWPWAFTHADKRLEGRDWPPGLRRGDYLALHSGAPKSFDEGALELFLFFEQEGGQMRAPVPSKDEFVTSAVVAVLRFWGLVTSRPGVHSSQRAWWAGCKYGWVFDEVHVLSTPVPTRGYQGIWRLPDDVLDQVVRGPYSHTWTSAEGWGD